MIPGFSWPAQLAAAALLATGAAAWAWSAGVRSTEARHAAQQLQLEREAGRRTAANIDRGHEASAAYQAERQALAAQLRRSRDALSIAMRAPVLCPASGQLGDFVLPAGALAGVRDAAAGAGARHPADAGRPGAAVR